MKVFKRSLAVILALCMMLGVVPFTAFASENTSAYSNTTFERILHLDCGRKYFTADWIKALINEMKAAGYTHLQLAFGNDGLRFLLDDMSVTVDGTTYSSDNVAAGVKAGNKAYYNAGDVNELTESEMDEIITHAQSMGIEIVPHLNMPGHMDAVLDAIEYVGISNAHFTGYTTSVRSLNLNNNTAVAFAKALLQKYVDYFAAKGCTYFHIGADEFANDAYYGFMGFPSMGSTMYSKFADFVNDCAAIVDEFGMTPRAWNDGISYTGYNASFKPYIQITYWSSGWGGYDVASASTLSSKHDMINTHGDYYFILASTGITNPIDKALEFDNSTFAGSNISDPVGSMFCIWCDVPGSATEQEVAAAARITLRKMAAAMQNTNEYSKEIVPGGFNTDGSINYITVENSDVSVTAAAALTGLTVTETTAPAIEGAAEGKVAAWNITPATADGAYTGSAAVAVPVPDGWNNVRGGVMASANGEKVLGITGTLANGVFTFEVPHFSTVVVYEVAPAAVTETVNVTVGVNGTYTHTDDSGYHTSYEGLNTAIATVELGGSDGTQTEVEFKKISITYRSLLNSNKTKYQTEYYVLDNGKYYPLYVTRTSTRWFGTTYYTYTYYYDNGTDLEYFDEDTGITNLSNNVGIDIYQAGDTVTIPAKTTITFTGVKEGTTSVQVGNTLYNVTVVPAGLSEVAPLTVEYWATNLRVTANSATTQNISALDAYGANGVLISSLIPVTGELNGNTMGYWKTTRLDANNEQTTDYGDDETRDGTDFKYIRYFDGVWEYSAEGTGWTNVLSTDQIVAYYMQITEVTDEVTTQVVDWGVDYSTSYSIDKYILVDYAVKYESGEIVPEAFPITGTTLIFHCNWESDLNKTVFSNGSQYYRRIGMIRAEETTEYEVYMITLTPTSDEGGDLGDDNAYSNGTNIPYKEFYAGTEKVIWVDDEANLGDFADESLHYTSISGDYNYSVGGEPIVPALEVYNETGMLVTYYVRAKATEDALTVHYIDASEGANNLEFYNYNIAVKEGTTFNENIGLNDSNPNGNLLNGTIKNYYNREQTVSADLSTLSQVGAQYLYTEYECVEVTRSADGKHVYLYYEFNPTVYFVADFGLPMTITAADLNAKLDDNVAIKDMKFSGVQHTVYGQLTDNGTTVTYAPDEILQGYDYFTLLVETESAVEGILDAASATIAFRVYIVPATTVYYEEGFLFTETTDLTGWSGKTSISTERIQATEILSAHKYNYGYDPAYSTNSTKGSDNSCAIATVTEGVGAYTSFTFTGTGFELYANSQKSTGVVTVLNEGSVTKLYRIDTKLSSGITGATQYASGTTSDATHYGLPIISETALPYGTYTVQIKQNNVQANTDGRIEIDGVRIINTIADSTVFAGDLEDNPEFYELRDYVLKAVNVENVNNSEYGAIAEIAKQVYAGISTDSEAPAAVITDIKAIYGNDATAQDLLDNGPKNELYLWPGQSLTFNVSTNRVMQLGLKAPKSEAIFSVTVDGTKKTVGEETTITNSDNESETWRKITSTVDMFYKIADKITNSETTTTHTVTITVNSGLLSVTKLKICDDPNAAFVALTQEDIENALLGIYGLTDDKTPVEPEEPAAEADAVLAITLTDGKKEMGTAELTAVGAEGEKHTFTAEEILNAVLDAMPDLYKVSDESAITDVIVKYGETGELTVDIELEFEFDMDSWWRQVRTLMNRIFTIIADAGNGGSITNEGSADVKFRKDITYTITPDEGYEIESVIVDGKDVGAVSEYTFRRVRNDHRISVTFKEVQ